MRHVTKLCGEEKTPNSDLLNCLIPRNKRIQGGMYLGKKNKKKMGNVLEKTGWRVDRWFTKTSHPVPGPFLLCPVCPAPQNPQGNVPINMQKNHKNQNEKDPLSIAWEYHSSPLPQGKERKILKTLFPPWVFPATKSQLLKHLFSSLGKGEEHD